MSRTTIGALLGGAALAISEAALPFLNADLPDQETGASLATEALQGAGVEIGRGERFAVHRGVAYVPVRGILSPNSALLEKYMGWATYHGLTETMDALTASDEVRAVVMFFDTPGGAVIGIQGAAEAIKACAAVKPVHGLVHPLAASAGYWLASQCREIIASPGSWVGSVGTMLTGFQPMQPGSGGDQGFILTSQHAGAKRPDLSSEDGRAVAMVRLDAMEAEFHAAISEGRGISVEDLKSKLSRSEDSTKGGDVFWGADAVARGLVDGIETVAAFMARISELYAPKSQARSQAYLARASAARAQASL
ncbi:MAG: peptidase S49 [Alphaproteobacteria bacterium MedPE-SWcel]|nr:MAG: peptidase S49 [Alphaproteobacteria bacterium MedPE-SWcel]